MRWGWGGGGRRNEVSTQSFFTELKLSVIGSLLHEKNGWLKFALDYSNKLDITG